MHCITIKRVQIVFRYFKSQSAVLVSQSYLTFCDPMDYSPLGKPTRLTSLWNSPGKNPGVDCHALLQEISPPEGLNSSLLHCRRTHCCLSH